ncbi:nucleic-acid-binding protein from transposon X-element [Trichonephila clavipes]|nr:nucleic-acid-binding protein from transposon X-element [Trichonephila clavipes]
MLKSALETPSRIKEKLLNMEFVQSDAQMCDYISMKWQHARVMQNSIQLFEGMLDIDRTTPGVISQAEIQASATGLEQMKKELPIVLGGLASIFCPVKDCPSHTNRTKNDSDMAESSSKINEANNPKQNSKEKIKRLNNNNVKDNPKSNKRAGQEDFKTPTKIARKIIEVPIEKVVCTSKNKFAVLEDEEGMDTSTPTPKIKPIMMKINKNYNLILQEIYRSYPNTVNKNTGNYIKIQPATAEDQDKIKNLIIKKADHYTIEHPTVIKAVIKGLTSSTNVTDIETELKTKGFEVEKIAQLRKFTTKSPLPLFMIQIKRSENAQDIFKLNNLNYLTVEVVPFRRRPGASQCFNCNYFNHTSKNCKMTPRCLKCEGSHRTQDCHTTERLQTIHCINCNEDGHLASSRQCPKFPKLKLKQKTVESQTNKTINPTRPVTAEISYTNVCSNKTKQQMAPRGETPKTQNQTPNEKQDNETLNFLNFATYINELQNLTSKFPEIFQALEDMSKTNNDIEKLNIFLVAVARSCNRASQN